MAEAFLCPHCQNNVPGDAPQGLCPACRMQPSAQEAATLPPQIPIARTQDPATLPPLTPARPGEETVAPPEGGYPTEPASSASTAKIAEIHGYEVLGELGRGGMGVVYKARHLALRRTVALKMILGGGHAGSAELDRFRTEAESIARLQHPNIVQIHEVGEHDGMPFFSLEFCPGGGLDRKLAGTPLPPREAAALVEKLAHAMQAAHAKGVIHRDLKPANVLLTENGTPKITDFGLAKKLDEEGKTQDGSVMGTPSYMAPEQASGKSKELGPACDIYSLGAILYELLTGRPPFKAATPMDTIMQVVTDEPVPPRQRNAKVDPDLEGICLKCLEKAPNDRYSSAATLAEDLNRFLAGDRPIHARPLNEWASAVRWARKHWITATFTILAVFLILLVDLVAVGYNLYSGGLSPLVAALPGFLTTMAILVRPRRGVLFASGLFLVVALGLPLFWFVLLGTPNEGSIEPFVPFAFALAIGIITAGVFGGTSFGIARWHRCDMLSVFFGGATGAVMGYFCCCGGVGLLAMIPSGQPNFMAEFNRGNGMAIMGMMIAMLIGPLLGFCLGATAVARSIRGRPVS